MSLYISKAPDDLSSSLGRKWLEAVATVLESLRPTYTGILAATGTTQATAARVLTTIVRVTSATGGVNDSILLPSLVRQKAKAAMYVVYNVSGATINIFPEVGENINELAANAAITLATGGVLLVIPAGANRWITK